MFRNTTAQVVGLADEAATGTGTTGSLTPTPQFVAVSRVGGQVVQLTRIVLQIIEFVDVRAVSADISHLELSGTLQARNVAYCNNMRPLRVQHAPQRPRSDFRRIRP